MKTLHLSILLTIFAVIMSSFILTDANAISPFLQTGKTFHVKGDIILVYGSVGNYIPNMNASIQILDNKNNHLLNYAATPKDDGTFLVRIPTNNTNWKTGGPYKISVQYGTCCHVGDSTFTFYADQLPPLKQDQLGTVFWDIACDSGLVKIMKQEDGFVACVNPNSVQKLVSRNWGYDPSEKLTTYGLKSTYHVGQEIDFKFRVNGFGNRCKQPSITVRNSDQQTVWSSSQYISSCRSVEKGHMENEAFLGNETHHRYDYNGYGILAIKQPGTYFVDISWLDGNVTKEFTVIANDTSHNNNSDFSTQASVNETTYRDSPHHTGYPIVGDTQGIVVNNDAEASRLTGFDVRSPTYLPQGYKVQLIKASKEIPTVTIFVSKFPLTNKTTSHDFLWAQKGILITFDRVNPRELRNYDQIFAGANKININGTRAVVTDISTGYDHGYQYDMWGSILAIQNNDTNIAIDGFLNSDDFIKIATSMLEK